MELSDKYPAPPDFKGDCTVPRILKRIFRKYAEDCRWHDWARRHLVHYGVISVEQADAEIYRRWVVRGMWRWFARLSWNAIKLRRDRYSETQSIPADMPHWFSFLKEVKANGYGQR